MSAQKCQKCGVRVFFYRDEFTGAEKCPSCGTTNPHTPEEEELRCRECGSNQLTTNKQGYGWKKGLGVAVCTVGVGALAGFINSNKVWITCLKCGHRWKAGKS